MKAHAKWVRPSRPVPEIWVHDESPAVTEDSAMAKAPAGTTEGPATVEEVSSEDELEDITSVMEEVWTPPYHAPESTWNIAGPLDHAQTPYFTFCLLCEKWCSAGHLMSAGHSSAMQRWMQSGKPLLQIPLRFADDERVEMLIQSRHPTWSRRTTLAAKQAIPQMAYYRAQEGTFRGEMPPEMDENPVTPPRRPVTPPKQPPRQKAKVEPSPVLQPPMPVGACGSASTAGACGSAPVGGTFTFTNTAAVAASFHSGPDVLVDTNAGTEGRCSVQLPVGAKLPSERRVGPPIGGGERGMADSAEPGASCAAKAGGQIIANATSGTAPLHGSTAACPYKLHEPAAAGLFEFYDHPMESSARLWQLASSASGAKGAASGSLKDHAVPKGQLIARHSAGAALPPREPKPVYASCAESLSVGLAPHVTCSACGSSVAAAAPVQDANMKNNQEPDTRHRDPAAGLGLAADQGELFLSSDPETRRELHKRLSHVSQGHVPYWANCEACNRSRGLTPARMRGDRPEKEYQVDQFMYRSRCFIILVHVLAFAVAVTFRPEGMSGREASTYLEPWLAHFGLSQRGNTKPSFYSDPEPLTINIAQALAERYEGHSESFAPERHAPVAERAVRTLKGIVSSHELQLRENGVVLGDDPGTLELLFRYAAHVHNRFCSVRREHHVSIAEATGARSQAPADLSLRGCRFRKGQPLKQRRSRCQVRPRGVPWTSAWLYWASGAYPVGFWRDQAYCCPGSEVALPSSI